MYLWPWITQTAGFLMNRISIKKHSWKTAFKATTKQRSNLSHLKRYRCKAYPLDKSLPRKEKITPRAYIEFLVGYEDINIYDIWIPSQHKVIKTRDITFNKTSYYTPHEIDSAQLVKKPFLYNTLNILYTNILRITELESDSDEDLFTANPIQQSQQQISKKGKEKEIKNSFLPSPSPSTVTNNITPPLTKSNNSNKTSMIKVNQQIRDLIREGQKALNDTYLLSASIDDQLNAPELSPTKKPRKPRDPEVQEDNILPDIVTRRRKPKKLPPEE